MTARGNHPRRAPSPARKDTTTMAIPSTANTPSATPAPDRGSAAGAPAALVDGFAHDPVASHSAQFGLARPTGPPAGNDEPSPAGVRPWNLRAAQHPGGRGIPIAGWRYDHDQQIAVAADGRPLAQAWGGDPTANSVSDLDGDEGRSEDWSYDFCPDQPGSPV